MSIEDVLNALRGAVSHLALVQYLLDKNGENALSDTITNTMIQIDEYQKRFSEPRFERD